MTCTCIRHTDLPHSTRLFADLVYHFDRVRDFYPYPPFAAESFAAAAGQIQLDPAHRRALVAALEQENRDNGPAAQNHLDRLSRPETLVVASGQQVGLYSGPIFTIYKALSAARLATELTARGIPSVPVFWLATEDHDVEEVNHAWVFDASNQPVRLQAGATPASHQPVGGLALSDSDGAILRDALSGFPFGEEVTRMAAEAYSNGTTFGSGFKALLSGLLARYGILLLDPLSPAIRGLAAPLMRRAIENAPDVTAALLDRGKELESRGYHVQVHMEERTSLFFLLEEGRRTALRRSGDTYAENGASYRNADLLSRLDHQPEDFSPNALLRPVVQDFLLPTVAYIGGPAELAYLAQAGILYQRLLGRMPVVLPRAAFTLLDARAQKLMARYGLSILDILHGPAPLEERIAQTLIPGPLQRALETSHQQMHSALDTLNTGLVGFDPTLAAALDKSRRKMEYQFSTIRAKVGRESLRRTTRVRAEAAYLSNLIFPEKTLQERLYSVLPFLARHGMDLIPQLHDSVQFECPDHQVLTLE